MFNCLVCKAERAGFVKFEYVCLDLDLVLTSRHTWPSNGSTREFRGTSTIKWDLLRLGFIHHFLLVTSSKLKPYLPTVGTWQLRGNVSTPNHSAHTRKLFFVWIACFFCEWFPSSTVGPFYPLICFLSLVSVWPRTLKEFCATA